MTDHHYANWRDVPDKLWRWPNFSPEEIACRGDDTIRINEAALDKLQALRDRLDVPMIIHSAYRSPDYNRQVGGAIRVPLWHPGGCDQRCFQQPQIWHASGEVTFRVEPDEKPEGRADYISNISAVELDYTV